MLSQRCSTYHFAISLVPSLIFQMKKLAHIELFSTSFKFLSQIIRFRMKQLVTLCIGVEVSELIDTTEKYAPILNHY